MQKPLILLVAAPRFKSIGLFFLLPFIRDREVGGSNPLAPTNNFRHLRLPAKVAVLVLWLSFNLTASTAALSLYSSHHFNVAAEGYHPISNCGG